MKTFRSLFAVFAVVAATALCASTAAAQVEQSEQGQAVKILTTTSVTYRDPNFIHADLQRWVPPKTPLLWTKAADIDSLFTISASQDLGLIAGITKMGHGGGSGWITSSHVQKNGSFVEGGTYVPGTNGGVTPWGKNLTS